MSNTKSISNSSVSGVEMAMGSNTSTISSMAYSEGVPIPIEQDRHSFFDLFKSFGFWFFLFAVLPFFVYCSVFFICSFGLAGIFLGFLPERQYSCPYVKIIRSIFC